MSQIENLENNLNENLIQNEQLLQFIEQDPLQQNEADAQHNNQFVQIQNQNFFINTTPIFKKAIMKFKFQTVYYSFYSLAKTITAIFLILFPDNSKSEGYRLLELWVLLIIFHGMIAFFYYLRTIQLFKNQQFVQDIAEALHCIVYEPIVNQESQANSANQAQLQENLSNQNNVDSNSVTHNSSGMVNGGLPQDGLGAQNQNIKPPEESAAQAQLKPEQDLGNAIMPVDAHVIQIDAVNQQEHQALPVEHPVQQQQQQQPQLEYQLWQEPAQLPQPQQEQEQIAEIIGYAQINENDLNQLNSEEENKRIQNLIYSIKWQAKKQNKFLMIVGNFTFLLFQALIMWSLSMIIISDQYKKFFENSKDCSPQLIYFQMTIIFLGFIQYSEFYIMTFIIGILIPFVIIYSIFWLISTCIKKYRNNQFASNLKSQKYCEGTIKGDPECTICMQTYSKNDELIILSCRGKHHFHAACIRKWLKISKNCPMCRENLDQLQDGNDDNQAFFD